MSRFMNRSRLGTRSHRGCWVGWGALGNFLGMKYFFSPLACAIMFFFFLSRTQDPDSSKHFILDVFQQILLCKNFFWKIAHHPSPSKKSLSVPNAFLTLYVFVWTKTKQNNFDHTSVFAVSILLSSSLENEYFLMRFRPSSCKTPVNVDGSDSIWRFFDTVFKSLRFHLSTLLETARFQNDRFFFKKNSTFEKPFS